MKNTRSGFPADYRSIMERLESVDPVAYARTRNYSNGQVTFLSPYISRGVISIRTIASSILSRYSFSEAETLIRELAWREYFQRVWESCGDKILTDLASPQSFVLHHRVPVALAGACTGIGAVDQAIRDLYETGYMHNHLRMYLASVCCNIAGAHWRQPAAWMYYHLLDGDPASNSLSWQWVAGSFSSKKYYSNQENINRYTGSTQKGTYLDRPYEAFPFQEVPPQLTETENLPLTTVLPAPDPLPEESDRIFIYNSLNLDPAWHEGENGTRILLLEPEHFKRYPISPLVLEFILSLRVNIPGIRVFCGSFDELKRHYPKAVLHFKKHPSCMHYRGEGEEPAYLFPGVKGFYRSFSSYWKECQKQIRQLSLMHSKKNSTP